VTTSTPKNTWDQSDVADPGVTAPPLVLPYEGDPIICRAPECPFKNGNSNGNGSQNGNESSWQPYL
jgi:hypothetical protein